MLQFKKLTRLLSTAAPPKILITGGRGQLGRGLAKELQNRYGDENVILSDISFPTSTDAEAGYTSYIDVTDYQAYREYTAKNRVNWIIHLPALLSATCEANIPLAMKINVDTMHNAFRIADEFKCKLFIPSSIGAFGPTSPLEAVPDQCIQDPHTYYGVSKVYAEQLGSYYNVTRGLDFRCLRYPGIISAIAEPGGGTTDYAVDIFKQVVGKGEEAFECYLKPDARLPMMVEEDCVTGTCDFLAADDSLLSRRVYNLGAIDFTPKELSDEMKKYVDFEMKYNPDPLRQSIAENWPKVFVDEGARNDWGWKPKYGSTAELTKFMMENIPKEEPKPKSASPKTKPAVNLKDEALKKVLADKGLSAEDIEEVLKVNQNECF